MPRRAGKRRTAKRALIAKIKEAQKKDEETRRAAPRIIEEQILLLRVRPRDDLKGKKSSSEDSLHLFPEELDRDLNWSPDEFDREYFRLWEEENNERWERKRERRRRKLEVLFGEDSETEGERREIEKDKKEREGRDSEEEGIEVGKGERIKEKEEMRMEWEEERREEDEMEEKGEEEKEMDWESDDDVVVVETRVDRLEKEIGKEIERRNKEEKRGGAGARRVIVPKRVKKYWLKARSRLDLSVPLPIKGKF